VDALLADHRYSSDANVNACAQAGVVPLMAMGRERHHVSWRDCFGPAPPAPDHPSRWRTDWPRRAYALRKHTPKPVFGLIKSVMGFRQFSLRGLANVRCEGGSFLSPRNHLSDRHHAFSTTRLALPQIQ
jgi:hypothetical protein